MDPSLLPLLTLAGFVAGFINTLAGGGSMLTLPLMVALGLPANVANGTNRIAILLQNVVAVAGFAKLGVRHFGLALRLIVPTGLGAACGSWLAASMNSDRLERVFGVILVALCLLIVARPSLWTRARSTPKSYPKSVVFLSFLAIGFWGGFAQIGVGFLFLGALVACGGWNLVDANAIKVTLILGYTILSLVIFGWHGQVDPVAGGALALGNMGGGWLAAHTAVKKGSKWVKAVLLIGALLGAIRFLIG